MSQPKMSDGIITESDNGNSGVAKDSSKMTDQENPDKKVVLETTDENASEDAASAERIESRLPGKESDASSSGENTSVTQMAAATEAGGPAVSVNTVADITTGEQVSGEKLPEATNGSVRTECKGGQETNNSLVEHLLGEVKKEVLKAKQEWLKEAEKKMEERLATEMSWVEDCLHETERAREMSRRKRDT